MNKQKNYAMINYVFMARHRESMDGFVSRRPERRVGGIIGGERLVEKKAEENKKDEKDEINNGLYVAPTARRGIISRSEIDESLSGIDDEEAAEPKKRRKNEPYKRPRKKWIKIAALLIVVILAGVGSYVGFRAIIAGSNIFQGNIFDIFQNAPLQEDANGRSNILILGTSQDDPGHAGGVLTDSMMIMSIDQHKKNAYMISIPRDLYVQYGRACASGYAGKINVFYSCVGGDSKSVQQDRQALMTSAKFIGSIVGLNIQYGVNVDYTVMRQLVKAVGGTITVDIQGDGDVPYGIKPGSVMDSNFDWKCGANYYTRLKKCAPRGHFIDYPPGPAILDAEHALYLAQARGDSAPTWGLAQSNFDREANQRKIVVAIRDKALSTGVLTDFGKVTAIIDALGNNLRTTFEAKEVRTLASLAKDIKSSDINSIPLNDVDNPVMGTGNVAGQSVVVPSAGTYDYSQLQALIHRKLSSNPVIREAAPVLVLNGSGVAGTAQTEADALKAEGYTLAGTDDAPSGNYKHYTVYKIGDGNDGTAGKLEERYHVKITNGKPPLAVGASVKFVVIIGPLSKSN